MPVTSLAKTGRRYHHRQQSDQQGQDELALEVLLRTVMPILEIAQRADDPNLEPVHFVEDPIDLGIQSVNSPSEAFDPSLDPGLESIDPSLYLLDPGVDLSEPGLDLLEPRVALLKPRVDLLEVGVDLFEPGLDLFEPGIDLFKAKVHHFEAMVDCGEAGHHLPLEMVKVAASGDVGPTHWGKVFHQHGGLLGPEHFFKPQVQMMPCLFGYGHDVSPNHGPVCSSGAGGSPTGRRVHGDRNAGVEPTLRTSVGVNGNLVTGPTPRPGVAARWSRPPR
ncbi:MAG: hypothetical protein H6519_03320 [Microthrixaceae bacterium]|nr:hypothetical protein [Acidimicrobiales bacterium]MCB9403445.1 hypothetical protein [Microthrixaceae bacterium]